MSGLGPLFNILHEHNRNKNFTHRLTCLLLAMATGTHAYPMMKTALHTLPQTSKHSETCLQWNVD
jgi:hypothetical protein